MATCEQIKPLLYRVAECEADPEEAMRVARHLPDCTACRILLARDRRLATLLERDLEDLPVGEDFVRAVMKTLPPDPPSPRRRKPRLRGLKLACVAILAGLASITLPDPLGDGRGATAMPTLPQLNADSAQGAAETLGGLIVLVATALHAMAAGLPLEVPSAAGVTLLLVSALGALFGGLLATSTVVALAARSLSRTA